MHLNALKIGNKIVKSTDIDGDILYVSPIIVGTQFVMPSRIIPCKNDGTAIINNPLTVANEKKDDLPFSSFCLTAGTVVF